VTLLDDLTRAPDVQAPNLVAVDATDRLLLDTAADLVRAAGRARSSSWATSTGP
jgi:16S rRNA (guanine1207-N2)-methyltransferase